MNPFFLIIGVFLFVSGVVLGRQSESPSSKMLDFNKSFESGENPSPTQIVQPTNTPEPSPSPAKNPTLPQTITSTPKPSTSPSSSTNLSDFRYPVSTTTSDIHGKLILSSSDSPSVITTWYENRIKELQYSSRSSAKTSTNGNVLNKLGVGKNDSSVYIEIQKKANENTTTITITLGSESNSDVRININNSEGSM